MRSGECDVVSLYVLCCSVNGSVSFMCLIWWSERKRLCVFRELCPVSFLVGGESSTVLLQSVVMSYVKCGDDG